MGANVMQIASSICIGGNLRGAKFVYRASWLICMPFGRFRSTDLVDTTQARQVQLSRLLFIFKESLLVRVVFAIVGEFVYVAADSCVKIPLCLLFPNLPNTTFAVAESAEAAFLYQKGTATLARRREATIPTKRLLLCG